MITLTDISIKYADRIVLDIPYLAFEQGKRYGLIGENGSGKTTLLRILAGTLQADTGKISGILPCQRGYMPQNPYPFSMSVLQNVEIALKKTPERESLAKAAVKAVGLEAFMAAKGNKLSGGEAQRMAFARIIAKERSLVLLDEPTSSTDIRGTDLIEETLQRYARATGCTLIFSTHAPAQALRLADEVIFLDQGRVVERGPAAQVIEEPNNAQARLFLQHWRI